MCWRLVVAVVPTTQWYCVGPLAITTPAGLPGWGPRSAPGSVLSGDQSNFLFSRLSCYFPGDAGPRLFYFTLERG
jgi:hypothetical protein